MSFLEDIFSGGTHQANETNIQAPQTYQANNDQLAAIQGQQQNFANQLQNQAAGNGPSVAQAMLNNAQSQNAANANAIAASQRGINPGMALRQALQANAAGGQAAAQQAVVGKQQEQLNAQGMLGGQLNQMFNQGMGSQQNNQMANLGAQRAQADINQQNAKRSSDTGGGLLNGLMKGISSAAMGGMAQGGLVQMAAGGSMPAAPATPTVNQPPAPMNTKDHIADYFGGDDAGKMSGGYKGAYAAGNTLGEGAGKLVSSLSQPEGEMDLKMPTMGAQFSSKGPSLGVNTQLQDAPLTLSKGGKLERGPLPKMKKVKALVSPGEVYLSPEKVKEVLKGADPLKIGHHVPGKAKVKGDSYSNDTVPAKLEEGGVVIPRHVTQQEKAPEKAALFVRKAVSKKGVS